MHNFSCESNPVFHNGVASPSSKKVALKAMAAGYVSKVTLSSAVCPRCWAVENRRLQCEKPWNSAISVSLDSLPLLHMNS